MGPVKPYTIHPFKSITGLLLALVCLFSMLMSLTYAWKDFYQHSTNLFEAIAEYKDCSVLLTKYEIGKDGENGTPDVRVAGAEFYLYRIEDDLTETQIGGKHVTNAEGQLVIHSLPPGNYVLVETKPPYGYDFDKDSGGQPITRYPFTLGGSEPSHIETKAYNVATPQALKVTKEVKNLNGQPLTDAQKQLEFEFVITFSDGGSYDCAINGGATFTVTSGDTFKLKHGETALFTGLPIGLQYNVIEVPNPDYATTAENSQGNIPKEGAEAKFTNTCLKDQGSLLITKTVSGDPVPDSDQEFEFEVTFDDGGSYDYAIDGGALQTLASGGVLKLKAGQNALFPLLPIGLGYTVKEINVPTGYYPATDTITGKIIRAGSVAPFHNRYESFRVGNPGSLAIEKQLQGNDTDPAKEFAFTIIFGDGGTYDASINGGAVFQVTSGDTVNLKGGETLTFANLPADLGYTVTEADYSADGYTPSIVYAEGHIVSEHTILLPFINEKNTEVVPVLKVRKEVVGVSADKEFEFTIKIDDDAHNIHTTETFVLKNGETKEFNTLYSGTRYEITEQNYYNDGYIESSFHASGILNGNEEALVEAVFTNTWYKPEVITLSGEKTWDDTENPGMPLPISITVKLMDGAQVVEEKTVTPDGQGKWFYSFEAPKYRNDGVTEIAYTIVEEPVYGYWPEYTDNGAGTDIVNHAYTPYVLTTIPVEKLISGDTPASASPFEFTLRGADKAPMPTGSLPSGVKTITITGAGTGDFGEIKFDEPGTYVYTIKEVAGGLAGYTYDTAQYTVTIEITDNNGVLEAVVTVEKDGQPVASFTPPYQFTNPYQEGHTTVDVSVRKVIIESPTNPHPDFVKVQLYNAGIPQGVPVVLNVGNNWEYTWTGLDAAGVWTVDELDVPPGYIKEITGSVAEGFVITDRYDIHWEKMVIKGVKTWDHGKNPEANRPKEILVLVKQGDYVVAQKVVTAADNWEYQFELPKYDTDGNEIHYTIEEKPIDGYAVKVDGYNLHNRFTGNDSPKTNDNTNFWLWASIFTASALSLLGMMLVKRHKRKKRMAEIQRKLIYKRRG